VKVRSTSDSSSLYGTLRRGVLICLAASSLGILVNAVSPRGIPLLGPVPLRGGNGIEEIPLEEAWALHKEGRGVFVDARSAKEYRAGHIPRALLLSPDAFEETVSSWKDLLPADTLLITYCGGEGCESSRDVAALLIEEGYRRVKVFFGGWEQWKKAGYPVENRSKGQDGAG
jgi:rhodanese-related sulfurtransferase